MPLHVLVLKSCIVNIEPFSLLFGKKAQTAVSCLNERQIPKNLAHFKKSLQAVSASVNAATSHFTCVDYGNQDCEYPTALSLN